MESTVLAEHAFFQAECLSVLGQSALWSVIHLSDYNLHKHKKTHKIEKKMDYMDRRIKYIKV